MAANKTTQDARQVSAKDTVCACMYPHLSPSSINSPSYQRGSSADSSAWHIALRPAFCMQSRLSYNPNH